MQARGRVTLAGTLVVVVGVAAGWATLDALDLAPGVLTLDPPPAAAEPFPTAPGAVAAPSATPVVGDLDPGAPVPDAGAVTSWARALAADTRMGSATSVMVSDVLTGHVLADLTGSVGRTPASTAKILTAMAAMTALGPDTTLPTTVVQPEAGRLVLVGGGDMMLAPGHGEPDAVVGHAGLADLADTVVDRLRQEGVTDVRLDLDDTLFSGPAIHPRWDPSDVAHGYVAAVTPVAIDIAKTKPDEEYPPRYPDPALHTVAELARLLTDAGITVTGDPARVSAPADATELARVESAPVGQVVRYALHVSDNTIAEVLGRLVAVHRGLPGSFQGATSAVLAQLAVDGVSVTGTLLDDCSGLSARSRIPAAVLVGAVRHAAQPGAAQLLPVLNDLPVGGLVGTLADRFTAGPGAGLVRAKTGSLPGVTSLAGTVQTADGRLLAFAVLADRTPPGGQERPRAAIDAFVQRLAACGCTGAAA
ncbi:D-alanyl-D-alanine carboxypeptidase/D-alanyl-D-alanine-endopeptidase [Isoptericola sp. b441]|uniref:D-alanyl-D-alanine carboxypeptidase/D-alanyl-D-alanine-endopeptidase n=1 Tax=Actinotalea lenta TaxID=3064654 RepID=A0ABT9D806_9CELL|nr:MULTISPECIES: D-alanyl-D-alanine carboxypeptidase/D-alanyl-D-alanine-endopeptidase [unclassified Isoptericola]MDO8106581.1 D-alanyl-D-alanine carboxypeptidase/D-alanyl-D-alanine-endopeptidase [Isoptericola sp. b441]MDO8121711.1 D-alanyl-D-alanine carboxypeptidase/D-alanyl-D-alanine-endopeptidase [Isoptericola sp. b490]